MERNEREENRFESTDRKEIVILEILLDISCCSHEGLKSINIEEKEML
jgi:hypothetical protein